MKQLKINDNNRISKEDFYDIKGLTKKVADKTLGELEKEGVFVFPEILREAEDLTRDQMILQSINDTYQSENIMGFLGYGEERLIIGSRFSEGNKDFLFRYLLEKVMNWNLVDFETEALREDSLYSLLLFLFPSYLTVAMRKGLFKTYVRKEYNDSNVRGRIEINRHIRENVPFVGDIAYSQREYTYDNYLMQLIRHTVEYIKKKTYGNRILAKAKDEVKSVIEATPDYDAKKLETILFENKKKTVRHAYYHEYRKLQRLCILILQNEKMQIGIGKNKVYGILFDGAWLWEEYINSLVSDFFYHPMNKGGRGAQWLFAGNKGLIYPDFIGKNFDEQVVADAKYKPIDNIGNKDYLQVLAYMFRFEAKKSYYFYPEVNAIGDKEYILNSGSSYEGNVKAREDVKMIKHGLYIPSNVDKYEDFVSLISGSEKEFTKLFFSE